MPPPNKTEQFIWGAYHFYADRWTGTVNATRVSVAPIGNKQHQSVIWGHDGHIEIHKLSGAPSFFIEVVRQWVMSDYKEVMSLENFLIGMFP